MRKEWATSASDCDIRPTRRARSCPATQCDYHRLKDVGERRAPRRSACAQWEVGVSIYVQPYYSTAASELAEERHHIFRPCFQPVYRTGSRAPRAASSSHGVTAASACPHPVPRGASRGSSGPLETLAAAVWSPSVMITLVCSCVVSIHRVPGI